MNRVLLLTLVLILGATLAFAQGYDNGRIGIFADNSTFNPSWCLPAATGLLYVYFLHVNAMGATASQWAAPPPTCLTAVHLADLPVFAINLGNTASGITIGYGTCNTGSFHIMTALYQLTTVGTCCVWRVVPDPGLASGKIEIPDCEFNMTYGTGGAAIFGTNPNCCSDPTEDTTWGAVKALYTE